MTKTVSEINPAEMGLQHLMHQTSDTVYVDQCAEYQFHHMRHPFGLNVPGRSGFGSWPQIIFAGTPSTDRSVEVFLAHIRHWVVPGCPISRLRVINTRLAGNDKGHHYVFFEFWACDSTVVISGETTDFSGAGNSARRKLEEVFATLSLVYGINIERIDHPTILSLGDLRALRGCS